MKTQVQTQAKAPTDTTAAPTVSVFQSRAFGAQHVPDESPSFERDRSSLFATYLQRRAASVGRELGTPSTSPIVQRQENNTGLPDQLKTGIESLSGMAMDDVRVHYNSPKPAQLQALAYTQGTDIHVAPRQERHLPHEAWHVVQQKQGRVRPTMQMKGVGVNDDRGLEREADVMGGKALQMRHTGKMALESPRHNMSGLVQRYPYQNNTNLKDALIYAITTNDLNEVIYVGQTTNERRGSRFIEHVNNDNWAPWWVNNGHVYGDDKSKWPYRWYPLEELKQVTKFETTVAEQWWLEKYMKENYQLWNHATPCTIQNFNKRSNNPDLYNPKKIDVDPNWVPSMVTKKQLRVIKRRKPVKTRAQVRSSPAKKNQRTKKKYLAKKPGH